MLLRQGRSGLAPLNFISGCAKLFDRSTHPTGKLRQFFRAKQEQHDEQDYHHVRPHQIQDTSDRWSHKDVSLNGRLFFTHSTILADLYSRRMVCGAVWVADICEMTAFPQVFLREWNKTGPR